MCQALGGIVDSALSVTDVPSVQTLNSTKLFSRVRRKTILEAGMSLPPLFSPAKLEAMNAYFITCLLETEIAKPVNADSRRRPRVSSKEFQAHAGCIVSFREGLATPAYGFCDPLARRAESLDSRAVITPSFWRPVRVSFLSAGTT